MIEKNKNNCTIDNISLLRIIQRNKYNLLLTSIIAFISVAGIFLFDDLAYTSHYRTHSWSIGYYKNYILNHCDLPDVFNVSNHRIGNVYPIFYGKYFYFIGAIFSIILDVEYGLYFTVFIFTFLLSFFSYKLFYFLNKNTDRFLSIAATIFLVWAVYPLTNYQSRTAFIEWFANINIILGCILWFLSIFSKNFWQFMLTKLLFIFFMILGVNGHAITTYYYSYIVIIGLLFSFKMINDHCNHDKRIIKKHIISFAISSVIIFLTSVPWLIMCIKFMNKIYLGSTINKIRFRGMTDLFWNKISFFIGQFSEKISIPNPVLKGLHAQIIMPYVVIILVILFASIIYSNRKIINSYIIMSLLGLLLGLFILLSTSIFEENSWLNIFPNTFSFIFAKQQFAYRSSGQVNIILLFSLIFIVFHFFNSSRNEDDLIFPSYNQFKSILNILLSIMIFISYTNVLVKQICLTNKYLKNKNTYTNQNYTDIDFFHGVYAYYVYPPYVNIQSKVKEEIELFFDIDSKHNFGEVKPKQITISKKTKVNINIAPFPWNYLKINDKVYSLNDLQLQKGKRDAYLPLNEKIGLFIILDEGHYIVEYIFKPETWYYIFNIISKSILVLLIVAIFAYFIFSTVISLQIRKIFKRTTCE